MECPKCDGLTYMICGYQDPLCVGMDGHVSVSVGERTRDLLREGKREVRRNTGQVIF